MKLHKFTLEEPWTFIIGTDPDFDLVITKFERPGIEHQIIRYGKSECSPHMPSWLGTLALEKVDVGWPMTSLSTGNWSNISEGRKLRVIVYEKRRAWAIPNSLHKLFPYTYQLILPYGVIWPGFAINIFFYAVILWILLLIPFAPRQMIRRKRGLCIKCGYDLRESPDKCPECGWGREAEA